MSNRNGQTHALPIRAARLGAVLVALVAALLLASTAQASPVTIHLAGTGTGTVTAGTPGDPTGIECGNAGGGTPGPSCTHDFPSLSTVTLNAEPDPGFAFTGWSAPVGLFLSTCEGVTIPCSFLLGPNGGELTATFGPPPPEATSSPATNVDATAATLHGAVNPLGEELTECRFQYGPTTNYGQSVPCAEAPGSIGSGTDPVPVHADVEGLASGTSYHFRLVATSANGTGRAGDQFFETLFRPTVVSADAVDIGITDVLLDVQLRAGLDSAATWYVEYGSTDSYGARTPDRLIDSSGGNSIRDASVRLSDLEPDSVYHLRVVATNENGTVTSADRVIHTFGPAAAGLPDNRAYEQVSAVDKNGNDALGGGKFSLATPDGDSILYNGRGAFAGAHRNALGTQYAAAREAGSWKTIPILPPGVSSGLDAAVMVDGWDHYQRQLVVSDAKLSDGAVEGNQNMYIHDSSDDSYQLVMSEPEETWGPLHLGVAAAVGDRVIFQTGAGSEYGHLYEWRDGVLTTIGVRVADPCAIPGGDVGCQRPGMYNAASADATQVYYSGAGTTPVYLYRDGQSTLVSADENGDEQPATFYYATPDGRYAFLTSAARLTADASPSLQDLYRYDAVSGELTDLTPTDTRANVANVLGVSDDGSFVYFVARGAALAPGAVSGEPNLYVRHDDEIRFIEEQTNQSNLLKLVPSGGGYWHVSPNGRWFGYQVTSGQSVFLYDYDRDQVNCVSCPRTGDDNSTIGRTQNVTDTGQVFFDTPRKLVASDSNRQKDVYEYVPEGATGCEVASAESGCLFLISTGQSEDSSEFITATPSGSDVFFSTREPLVGQDTDFNLDIYDARVDGGLPGQRAVTEQPCAGEGCRGPASQPPDAGDPSSATFSGPGNQDVRGKAAKRCGALLRRAKRAFRRARRLERRAHRAHGKRARRIGGRAERRKRHGRRVKRKARTCARSGK